MDTKLTKYLLLSLTLVLMTAILIVLILPRGTTSLTGKHVESVSIEPAQVAITNNGFIPSVVQIRLNQGVVFTNISSSLHYIKSDPYPLNNTLKELDSINPLSKNSSYTYIFNKTGTYTYHDDLNPYTFKGSVIVTR